MERLGLELLSPLNEAMESPRTHTGAQSVERLVADLRTHDDVQRDAAKKALGGALARRARDLTFSAFASELETMASRLLPLASSVVAEDAFAAVAAIGESSSVTPQWRSSRSQTASRLTRSATMPSPSS
jgi:hypothetical protein